MYVAPRPKPRDDPRFALRLGLATAAGFLIVAIIQPALAPLSLALPIGLLSSQRMAFDPGRVIGAPIAFAIMVVVMAGLMSLTRPIPAILLLLTFGIFFVGFYIIRRTGSPVGMLVILSTALFSIAALKQPGVLDAFRDGFLWACAISLAMIPFLYLIVPPATRERHVEIRRPAPGHHGGGALIRAVVLLGLCFWLYAVLPMSDMILAIAAIYPLTFPSGEEAFAEAFERSAATLLGAVLAIAALAVYSYSAHMPVLLLIAFAIGWGLGEGMMRGKASATVYQFALTTSAVLIATSLTSGNVGGVLVSRVVLTLSGSVAAAFLVALLEALFLTPESDPDGYSSHPAIQRRRFGREL